MPQLLRKIKKTATLLPTGAYRRALRHGVAAAIEHRAVIRDLALASSVDVGANVGQFSLLVRNEHPKAKIIAFEPLAGPAVVYKKLFADDPQVEFHQVALGPKAETLDMHVSQSIDSSSLLPISDLQEERFPGTKEAGRESVTVAPMSDFISKEQLRRPALLKIDVQGFELEVLKSAESLLPHFRWVYVEASFLPLYEGQALADEVIAYLQARDFKLTGLYSPSYDKKGQAVQADFLFENSTGEV